MSSDDMPEEPAVKFSGGPGVSGPFTFPREPRNSPGLTLDEEDRLLIAAALGVYAKHVREHAEKDAFASHSELAIERLEARVADLVRKLV